jgi:hypothetical protein
LIFCFQDLFATPGLFREPERVSDEDAGQVAQVLGMFSDAHNLINSKTSCIGIEYQPPTPAPSLHHHLIGKPSVMKTRFCVYGYNAIRFLV